MLASNFGRKKFLTLIVLMLTFFYPPRTIANQITKIATTNHPAATARNNGRRIVRTADDRRLVVYQDLVAPRPAIYWVYSDDGVNWSAPTMLAYGSDPALTIAENDWIYVVWILENGNGIGINFLKDHALTWESGNLPVELTPAAVVSCEFPVIEVTSHHVHLLCQVKTASSPGDQIWYYRYDRGLLQNLLAVRLSAELCQAEMPTMAGDLEFNTDLVHVVWTEFAPVDATVSLKYCQIDTTRNAATFGISAAQTTPFPAPFYPSMSARNYQEGSLSHLILSGVNQDSSGFQTALVFVTPDAFQIDAITTQPTLQNPMPSVDDVFLQSCAVVWQDQHTVFYGQNTDGYFTTHPPIPVSDPKNHARHPNVGYKTSRFDVFDVVWTEGEQPPFDIMYRRMAKQYTPLGINPSNHQTELPADPRVLQNYPNPFNATTRLEFQLAQSGLATIEIFNARGEKIVTLLHTNMPAGTHTITWTPADIATGLYFCRLQTAQSIQIKKMLWLK
ncbi:T9SS type A sorting domain-containing protein [candidate division KSB1 bacterium]|nr:T9SS type A sorting domain-containing protein [candidate division KSB1 bacterium]